MGVGKSQGLIQGRRCQGDFTWTRVERRSRLVDLFRYVEHDFAVPAATDAIDVANRSDFQTALGDAAGTGQRSEGPDIGTAVRRLAEEYLDAHFESPTHDPTTLGVPLNALVGVLGKLSAVTSATVRAAVRDTFGGTAHQVVSGADFVADLELPQNSVLAIKLATGFDRADTSRLARQLRAAGAAASHSRAPRRRDPYTPCMRLHGRRSFRCWPLIEWGGDDVSTSSPSPGVIAWRTPDVRNARC